MSRETTLYLSDYRRPQGFALDLVQGEVRPLTIEAKGLGSPTVSSCTWAYDVTNIVAVSSQAVSGSQATGNLTASLSGCCLLLATLTYSSGEKTVVRIVVTVDWDGVH